MIRTYAPGVVILVFATTYLLATGNLPAEDTGDPIGPRLFPYLIGVGLALSGIFVIVESVFTASGQPASDGGSIRMSTWRRGGAVAGVVSWVLVYLLLFEPLGFALSCSIFLLGFLCVFNRGRWIINVITAVCFSFGTYIVFTRLLGIQLAPGILPG